MRGIELPINLIVIIVLAVLTLVAVIALYMSGWLGPALGVGVESVKISACRELINRGCGDPAEISVDFDADRNGSIDDGDTLQLLCETFYGCDNGDTSCCKQICGCP